MRALLIALVLATPIPRDKKPDFTLMQPLLGAWHCLVASSRRPRPFASDATTFVSADGYWLVTKTVTPSVPWNPVTIHNTDYVTYDRTRSRWIDISMDDFGAYDVSVSAGWRGNSIVWNEVAYPRLHGAASFSPRTLTLSGRKKTVLEASFVEASGRRVAVTTTCLKR